MKYIGSKNRIAKYIIPIILESKKPEQWYVEPFCGGCNIIDKVQGKRIANDKDFYLIKMWEALVYNNWNPPLTISEIEYKKIKNNKYIYPPELVGYVGFNSYGAKFFGGYRRDKIGKRDYWKEHYNNIMKQVPKLKGVAFYNLDYKELKIPPKSIIYCDPPYKNSLQYRNKINYDEFWKWCREQAKKGHTIFISEYNAPKDFKCVWYKHIHNTLSKNTGEKTGTEKLFIA